MWPFLEGVESAGHEELPNVSAPHFIESISRGRFRGGFYDEVLRSIFEVETLAKHEGMAPTARYLVCIGNLTVHLSQLAVGVREVLFEFTIIRKLPIV